MHVRSAFGALAVMLSSAYATGFIPVRPFSPRRCRSRNLRPAAASGLDDDGFETSSLRERMREEAARRSAAEAAAEKAAAPSKRVGALDLSEIEESAGTLALGALVLAALLAAGVQTFTPLRYFSQVSTKEQVERLQRDRDRSAIKEKDAGRKDISDVRGLFYGLDSE